MSESPGLFNWLRSVPPSDPVVALLVANLFTLVLALVQGWDFTPMILVYWFQSVVIGITTVIQLLFVRIREDPPPVVTWLPDVSSWMLRKQGIRELPGRTGKVMTAGFFVFHYGGFHLVFLGFIWAISSLSGVAFPPLWELVLPAGVFLFTHLYSAYYYWPTEGLFREQMGDIFLQPYKRIIPMLAVATIGFLVAIPFAVIPSLAERALANGIIIVTFLLAKTYMDVRAHRKKHARSFQWGGMKGR